MRTFCFSRRQLAAALSIALLTGGCPPDHPDGADAGPGDAGAGNDAAVHNCLDQIAVGEPFAIDPDGTGTQIHADVAYDGQSVWVTYNRPNAGHNFDVYLTRLDCAGNPLLAPQRINTTASGNNVDPGVILLDSGLLVVWSADNQTGINNMDVFYRTFDRAGAPTMATDRILETTHQGDPVVGNVMEPSAAPLPGGGFAIAAIRGLDGFSSFQAFVQRLTAAGDLAGAAIDVVNVDGETQSYPTLAATGSGELYLAYSTESAAVDVSLVHSHLPAGSSTWNPLPPAVAAASPDGTAGSYAADRSDGRVLLAYNVDSNIVLRDGSIFTGSGRTLVFGAEGGADWAPHLVLAPGGGALFWYRNQSGYNNQFRVQRFVDDGSSLTAAPARALASPVPPYMPAATHIAGTIYFAAWSEGANPNFVIKGVFIDLAM